MSEHADDRPVRKLSDAKRDILARAPEGWFLVAAVGDGDNQRAGVHLQQMFQAGLVARRDDVAADVEYHLTSDGYAAVGRADPDKEDRPGYAQQ